MAAKLIKAGTLHRSLEFDRAAVNEEKRTVELAFSSDAPVERWFGNEILDHNSGACDLSRLNNGGALLLEHDPDKQIGVIESARIDSDRKGRAVVRFGTSQRANEIFEDVKGGIRRLVSVGYRIKKMVREKMEENVETFRATSWQPLELSIVAIPADASVGVGRSNDTDLQTIFEERNMAEPNTETPPAPTVNVEVIREEARKNEQTRIRELTAIGERMEHLIPGARDMATNAINQGLGLEHFRKELFEKMPKPEAIRSNPNPGIGMTEKDKKEYSLVRAINLLSDRKPLDGFELECHQECARKFGTDAKRSFFVPLDIIKRTSLISGTASLGGATVATDYRPGEFIDILRNRMRVAQMGATMLTGLNGPIAIPKQLTSGTATWAASELAATTESNLTLGQVTMGPKTCTSEQSYSKLLLVQNNPSVEALVRNDIISIIALALDLAALHGTGSTGQPTGLISVSGIGSVTIGENGGAPTWDSLVDLETEVALDNADVENMGYLTNAKVRGKLKKTYRTTAGEMPIWANWPGEKGAGELNGYIARVTNQVSGALTKGTVTGALSAAFFGNWADLVIGQWGPGIDLLVDPYSGAATRIIKIFGDVFADVGVRRSESFSACVDFTT
jgi:HK97 family phage major capsid protein